MFVSFGSFIHKTALSWYAHRQASAKKILAESGVIVEHENESDEENENQVASANETTTTTTIVQPSVVGTMLTNTTAQVSLNAKENFEVASELSKTALPNLVQCEDLKNDAKKSAEAFVESFQSEGSFRPSEVRGQSAPVG